MHCQQAQSSCNSGNFGCGNIGRTWLCILTFLRVAQHDTLACHRIGKEWVGPRVGGGRGVDKRFSSGIEVGGGGRSGTALGAPAGQATTAGSCTLNLLSRNPILQS